MFSYWYEEHNESRYLSLVAIGYESFYYLLMHVPEQVKSRSPNNEFEVSNEPAGSPGRSMDFMPVV